MRDAVDYVGRNARRVSRFKHGVPRKPHAGEGRYFLPAQTGNTPVSDDRKANILRVNASATTLNERAELLTPQGLIIIHGISANDTIRARLAAMHHKLYNLYI